ncbi:MAG: T9SS type A sorting domain-containing protein [Fibrobacteria bacterium]|nr:T9SS type A sorting domain-containing protein [Fibrobacteria bacterium]
MKYLLINLLFIVTAFSSSMPLNKDLSYSDQVKYTLYKAFKQDSLIPPLAKTAVTIPEGGVCLTPFLLDMKNNWELLEPETQAIARNLLAKKAAPPYYYDSPGGHFRIWYATSGVDALPQNDANRNGVPDLVERVADRGDEAWQKIVVELGYHPPLNDSLWAYKSGYMTEHPDVDKADYFGLDGKVDIYYRVLDDAIMGYAKWGYEASVPWQYTGYILLNPAISDWAEHERAVGHEFFHLVQYSYNMPWDVGGTWDVMVEQTATWVEDILHPDLDLMVKHFTGNDGYLGQGFLAGLAMVPLNSTEGWWPYRTVAWPMFLSQRYGNDIIKSLWQAAEEKGNDWPGQYPALGNQILPDYSTDLSGVFGEFMLWNYFTGTRDAGDYYYNEGQKYCCLPLSDVVSKISGTPVKKSGTLMQFTPHHTVIKTDKNDSAMAVFNFNAAMGIGYTVAAIKYADPPYKLFYSTGGTIKVINQQQYDELVVVAGNVNENQSGDFEFNFWKEKMLWGCMDTLYLEYDDLANVHDTSMCQVVGAQRTNVWEGLMINSHAKTLSVSFSSSYEVSIYDLRGNKMFSARGRGNSEYSLTSIKSRGVYLLKWNREKNVKQRKICLE